MDQFQIVLYVCLLASFDGNAEGAGSCKKVKLDIYQGPTAEMDCYEARAQTIGTWLQTQDAVLNVGYRLEDVRCAHVEKES